MGTCAQFETLQVSFADGFAGYYSTSVCGARPWMSTLIASLLCTCRTANLCGKPMPVMATQWQGLGMRVKGADPPNPLSLKMYPSTPLRQTAIVNERSLAPFTLAHQYAKVTYISYTGGCALNAADFKLRKYCEALLTRKKEICKIFLRRFKKRCFMVDY